MPNVIFQTLDETIRGVPFGPNNDVTVPVGDPVTFRDGGLNVPPLTIEKTQAQSAAGDNPAGIRVIIESEIDAGIIIRNADFSRLFSLRNNGVVFVPKLNTPAPSFYLVGVQTRDPGDTEAGGNLWINGGTAQDGPSGGNVFIFGGFGNGGANNGIVHIGPFNTSEVLLGSSSIPTNVEGDLFTANDADVGNDLTVQNNLFLFGNFVADGEATFNGALEPTGNQGITTVGDIDIEDGDLTFSGISNGRVFLNSLHLADVATPSPLNNGIVWNASGIVNIRSAGQTAQFSYPTVTGSRGANAALTSLLASLASMGLLQDSTTA